MMLTQERLHEVLQYFPETGKFFWKVSTAHRIKIGDEAGAKDHDEKDRVLIRIDRKLYLAHRLAWFYMNGVWPEGLIDHKNRDPSDNRIDNLRLATRQQNSFNSSGRENTTSKYKGVCYSSETRRKKRWLAQIEYDGKHTHLGRFLTEAEAKAAYDAVAIPLHGEFAEVVSL